MAKRRPTIIGTHRVRDVLQQVPKVAAEQAGPVVARSIHPEAAADEHFLVWPHGVVYARVLYAAGGLAKAQMLFG